MIKLAAKAAASVDISTALGCDLQGAKIGEAIRRLRIKAIADVINTYKQL